MFRESLGVVLWTLALLSCTGLAMHYIIPTQSERERMLITGVLIGIAYAAVAITFYTYLALRRMDSRAEKVAPNSEEITMANVHAT